MLVSSSFGSRPILLAMLFLLVSCGQRRASTSETLIIGGQPTQAPAYFAALHQIGDQEPFCGGSLIAPHVVITAAHCVSPFRGDLAVWMGMTSVDSKPTPIQAQAIIRHPRYHNRKFQHDLALVFLESSMKSSWLLAVAKVRCPWG